MSRVVVGCSVLAWISLVACSDGAPPTAWGAPPLVAGSSGGAGYASVVSGSTAGNASVSSAGIGTGSAGHGDSGGSPDSAGAAGAAGAGPSAGAGAGAAGSPAPPPPAGTALRAEIVARSVAPGDEQHVCVIVPLDNAAPVWVSEVRATLLGGSHHLIVDRQAEDVPLQLEPEPCSPTMAGDATRLIIAQQRETQVVLPQGVAFKLAPRQPVFLQLHYINLDDTPIDIRGSVELIVADSSVGAPIEAKSRFTGATNINIPAHSPATVESFVKPPLTAGSTVRVFALTSHTHRLGVRSTIERVAATDAPEVMPLHVSTDWAEPPLTQFDPPLSFDGTDGLRLTCEYMNDTDAAVTFGVLAEQEMCFMWLYYYDE